jgi:X-Pro dipeptidyl-peptidase (S15 family)
MRYVADTDVRVPARDGAEPATTVWRPAAAGAYPVLLARTPYGRDDPGLFANPKLPDLEPLLRAGYAVAVQDVRGTGGSSGDFVPFECDADDGVDTVSWLTGRPWCDGTVGGWGGSYMGMALWLTAARAPRRVTGDRAGPELRRPLPRLVFDGRRAVAQHPPRLVVAHVRGGRGGGLRGLAAIDHCRSITTPGLHIGGPAGWGDHPSWERDVGPVVRELLAGEAVTVRLVPAPA